MFKTVKEKFSTFLSIWLVAILVNQLFIFHGCFAPYCLIAALPHTGFIAALLTYWLRDSSENDESAVRQKQAAPSRVRPESKVQSNFDVDEFIERLTRPDFQNTKNAQHARGEQNSFVEPEADWKKQEAINEKLRKQEPLKSYGDAYEIHIGRKFEIKGDLVLYYGLLRGFDDKGVDLIVVSRNDQTVNLVQCKNWKKYEFTVDHLVAIHKKLSRYSPDFYNLPPAGISHYLALPPEENEIRALLEKSKEYVIRKSLYLASKEVITSQVFSHLTHVGGNIYRYNDMKIVFYGFL